MRVRYKPSAQNEQEVKLAFVQTEAERLWTIPMTNTEDMEPVADLDDPRVGGWRYNNDPRPFITTNQGGFGSNKFHRVNQGTGMPLDSVETAFAQETRERIRLANEQAKKAIQTQQRSKYAGLF